MSTYRMVQFVGLSGKGVATLAFIGAVTLGTVSSSQPLLPTKVQSSSTIQQQVAKLGKQALRLRLPKQALYVGSYVRVPVLIHPRLQVQFDDLEFSVAEGPAGGVISPSRDATFNPKEPHTMLIAGFKPGTYTLLVVHKPTGLPLAKVPFAVDALSPQGPLGPSFVVHGASQLPAAGAAWGGGPSGLQNFNTGPATGTRRIALVFVDTTEQRFTTDVATLDSFRQRWRDHIRDGATMSGIARSVRRFYQEASRNAMDISLDVFGPYQMPGDFNTSGAGAGLSGHWQAAITAADADVNYNNYDTVLVVSQTVDATMTTPAKFAWPTASIGEWGGWVTGEGTITIGTIQMPNDWTALDGRQIYATASHELAHNLGLGDQYTPGVAGRNPGGWELMDSEANLPNFSLAHKMRLGWIDAAWVRAFNFASAGVPVDETLTLSPVNQGAPAAGRFVGAEVRVTDGLNYYFEYRKDNTAHIADRALPTNDRILATDVRSGVYVPPFARPEILLLPPDSDGDGPVLANGQNYREDDTTDPIYPVEFRADASSLSGATANLRIRYGVNDKPDPSIRPWGAPPWQTPDIEVRNARNAADSAWFNVPWQANPNQVIAKVKNSGQLDAPNVRVNFYVKNYNIGGAPEAFLGTQTQNIPAGATVEFQTGWVPPSAGHYCVVVRIPLYVRPGTPAVVEMTELNNIAQSNYDRFISPTASPAERKITSIEVGNPFSKATRVYVSLGQTSPFYRTYLKHKWLDLGPNEVRRMEVMFEYVGAPSATNPNKDLRDRDGKPNRVQLAGFVVNPADARKHHLIPLGGAEVEVGTGRAVKFGRFDVRDRLAAGNVVTNDGKPVQGGQVILTVTEGTQKGASVTNLTAKLKDGAFQIPVRIKEGSVRAYFLPPPGYGDATSAELPVR